MTLRKDVESGLADRNDWDQEAVLTYLYIAAFVLGILEAPGLNHYPSDFGSVRLL